MEFVLFFFFAFVFLAIGGSTTWKIVHSGKVNKRLGAPSQPAELGTYLCLEWGQRHFEDSLIEAGIMKTEDKTVCDYDKCPDCSPTRELRKKLDNVNRTMDSLVSAGCTCEWNKDEVIEFRGRMFYARERPGSGCSYHDSLQQRKNSVSRPPTPPNPVHQKGDEHKTVVGGYEVTIPKQVPRYASATMGDKSGAYTFQVYWKWVNKDGRTLTYRSVHPKPFKADYVNYNDALEAYKRRAERKQEALKALTRPPEARTEGVKR